MIAQKNQQMVNESSDPGSPNLPDGESPPTEGPEKLQGLRYVDSPVELTKKGVCISCNVHLI